MRSAHLLVLLAASVAASRRLAISSVGSLRGGGGDDPLSEAKAKWSGWLGDAKAKAASMGAPKAATDPALTQALSLIKKRTLVNCEKAVGLLRGAHTRDPANDDVKLELADALNAVSQPASPSVSHRRTPSREHTAHTDDLTLTSQVMRSKSMAIPPKALLTMALLTMAVLTMPDVTYQVMRIKTHANALVIEGTLDTPGNKKVWKALGDEALPLARDAYKSKPGDEPWKSNPNPSPNPNPIPNVTRALTV